MTWNFFSKKTKQEVANFAAVSTVVIKVTHRCNLDCSYCYESISSKGTDMSLEVFKSISDTILSTSQAKVITFLLHGGEPLLVPVDWYREALSYARNIAKSNGKEIRFSMQTNLIYLTEERIKLLKEFSIHPGISLDGPAGLVHTERGSESKVFENFIRLKRENIQCGILSTINSSNYSSFEQICSFLENQAGIKKFKANVAWPVGNAFDKSSLSAEQIHQAQIDIIEYMWTRESIEEENLLLEMQRFAGEIKSGTSLCHEKICGAGKKVIGVSQDGSILPCGRFTWNNSDFYLGKIEDENSLYSNKLESFLEENPENWLSCQSCEAKRICRFGCQAFIVRSKEKINIECKPTKLRFEYFKKNEKRLLHYLSIRRRGNISLDSITLSSKK